MKRSVAILFAAGALLLAGCAKPGVEWQYQTVSGPNDQVLGHPISEGWEPVGISVSRDGTRWFLLKKQKASDRPVNYQYKTVVSKNGQQILDAPANQGWDIVGVTTDADGSEWFLLKKAKTQVSLAK